MITIGSGYWPHRARRHGVQGMEFIVDRYDRGATLGDVRFWRHAENLKALWSQGIDPLAVQVREARRLGIDFWFRLG